MVRPPYRPGHQEFGRAQQGENPRDLSTALALGLDPQPDILDKLDTVEWSEAALSSVGDSAKVFVNELVVLDGHEVGSWLRRTPHGNLILAQDRMSVTPKRRAAAGDGGNSKAQARTK
jgi:hypothetical protein